MEIFNVLRLLQKKWYKFQDKDSQIYWILKSELVKAEFFRFFCLSINLPYYICIYAYLTRKHLSLITLYVYIYFDYCNINTSFSESSSLPHASSGQIVTQTTKWITWIFRFIASIPYFFVLTLTRIQCQTEMSNKQPLKIWRISQAGEASQ